MSECIKRLYVLLLLVLLFRISRACPGMCVCKWKNGKQTVECGDRDLLLIPEGMDPGTQVLEFSENKLQSLHQHVFLKMDLIHLQRIFLAKNQINSISDEAFKGLTNLVELDLSGNLLEVIPTFVDCPSLMRLILNFNPLTVVKRGAFNHLSFLNTLELSNCKISYVEEGAFQGLNSLEWLHLDGNRLTTIKGKRLLPVTLRGVELQGNLWECDCYMLDMLAWLIDFSIPHTVEPTCKNPLKLAGRAIKSVAEEELACLPEVSPTSFAFEIGEGRNISLMCQVHAIPEADISWWFQGQLLQNDTLVAPGKRLLYFIEDGAENKRSELFIYNINPEDNGTFMCHAENSAGSVQSNFTIKIILKEEPIVIIVAYSFEYLLIAVACAAALVLILVMVVIVSIIKCRRSRLRQQKREKTKEVALHYQQNAGKCAVLRENDDRSTEFAKENGAGETNRQEIMFYTAHSSDNLLRAISPVAAANQVRSPTSLRRYQLEQNPDLINDTESMGHRREGDGEDIRDKDPQNEHATPLMHQSLIQFPISCMRGSRKLYNIHSWDPGCSLDIDGYPVDYGLPKMHNANQVSENFYRTLPYNRAGKRQSAANPISRYSREAEFLSRGTQPTTPYEQYCSDVRYTADGYPARHTDATAETRILPSPPEGYKNETSSPASLPCCSAPAVHWPSCVPANIHLINPSLECNQSKFANVTKRCVSAQTDAHGETKASPHLAPNKIEAALNAQNDPVNEVLTESPDEGYEGEPSAV